MGSAEDDEDAYKDENPAHPVTLPEFYMARYPVTNAQFNHFWQEKGYETERYWTPEGWAWRNGAEPDFSPIEGLKKETLEAYKKWVLSRKDHARPYRYNDSSWHEPNRPVVVVTWHESLAYCNWLDEKMKIWAQECLQKRLLINAPAALGFAKGLAENRLGVRLPTEAEWEKAARGPKSLRWPWSNKWQDDCADTEEAKIEHTSPIGIFPQGKSPYGLLDMAGNTWEWTLSRWGMDVLNPDYKYPYTDGAGWNNLSGSHARILRGGSWGYGSRLARCASRYRDIPDSFNSNIGFRCVVSLAISDS
jgi:formylglycine-generating enzyme required for sulfatase activity